MKPPDPTHVGRRLGPFAAPVLDFRLPTFEAWHCDDDALDARGRLVSSGFDADGAVGSATATLRILGFETEPLDSDAAGSESAESPAARSHSPRSPSTHPHRLLRADGDAVASLTVVRSTLDDGSAPILHRPPSLADVRWHVVTDGRRWRLTRFPSDPSTLIELDATYEVDLEDALAGSVVAFKRFYAFFRAAAFTADGDESFLDAVAAASDAARRRAVIDVRQSGRVALRTLGELAAGDCGVDADSIDRHTLDRLKSHSLASLFRVLVTLYADSREPSAPSTGAEREEPIDLYSTLRQVTEATRVDDRLFDRRLAILGARLRTRIATTEERLDGVSLDRSDDVFARLDDHDLGAVGFLLGTTVIDGTRYPIDFADVPVETLGGVYESLTACTFVAADRERSSAGVTAVGDSNDSDDPNDPNDPSDSKIGAVHLRLDDDDTGRRTSGAYYTPSGVVGIIVANAVGPLVDEVEATLDADGFAHGTDPYRVAFEERVLDLTVVDPAMGCGRFLLAATRYLTDRAAAVAGSGGAGPSFDRREFRRRVATRCLYGVDHDAMAVELALLSVWLAVDGVRLAELTRHFRVGNALVGDVQRESVDPSNEESIIDGDESRVDGDEPFHWWRAFPEHFGRRSSEVSESNPEFDRESSPGFDAVVGNPPYVRGRRLTADAKAYFRDTYRCASGAYDLYVLFVERAAALGRRTAFLVPNKWTTTRYGRPVRDLLLDEFGLESVLDLSDVKVFADASVYPVVVTFDITRDAHATGFTIRHVEGTLDASESVPIDTRGSDAAESTTTRDSAVTRDSTAAVDSTITLDVAFVDRLADRVLPLSLSPAFAPMATHTLASCDRLRDHVTITEGVHTGNVRDELVVDEWRGEDCRRLVDGRSVDRYVVDWSGRWIRHNSELIDRDAGEYAELRDPTAFECDEKLLLCDIGDRPTAAYDDERLYALNTLYAVRSKPESELPLRYVLAVFNSAFVERYFRELYGGTHVNGGYLRFKPMFCADVPIPAPSSERDAAVAAVAASIVSGSGGSDDADDLTDDADLDTRREDGLDLPIPRAESAVDLLCTLTDHLRALHRDRRSVTVDPLSYLDSPAHGTPLAELDGCTVVGGAGDGSLTETSTDADGGRLMIGRVTVERDAANDLTVLATVRRKLDPADADARPPDSWGYVESKPTPTHRLTGLDETTASLVEAFVPAAVDRRRGFAGFRAHATKTKSLLDRLGALRLPDPTDTDTVAGLRRYQSASRRASELDERLSSTEALVDRLVFELYGLSDDAQTVVAGD